MAARSSSRIVRIVAALVLALLGAWMAREILTSGLAAQAVENGVGPPAYSLRPDNPRAAALAAEYAFAMNNDAQAEALAREALSRSPIQVVAIRTLGMARERSSGAGAGDQLMLLAGQWGWRDWPTQLWLIDRALRADDLDVAVQRAEAVARLGRDNDIAFSIMRLLALSEEGRQRIIVSLIEKPAWRHDFLATAGEMPPEELLGMVAVLDGLAGTSAPPSMTEARGVIDRLVTTGQPLEAFRLYQRISGPAVTRTSLADGDFERTDRDYGSDRAASAFDWHFYSVGQSSSTVERQPEEGGNRALYAIADGATTHRIAGRLLVLPPGNYSLSYKIKSSDSTAPEGLQLSVRCVEQPADLLPPQSRPLQPDGWETRSGRFRVPASGCRSQFLEVQSRRTGDGEEREALFDQIGIAPASR